MGGESLSGAGSGGVVARGGSGGRTAGGTGGGATAGIPATGGTTAQGGANDAGQENSAGAEGGADGAGGGGEGGAQPVCETSGSPTKDACWIDDRFAVFAKNGEASSEADGSRERPFASLSLAVQEAVADKKSIVIACGNFDSGLELANTGNLRIYGGFTCTALDGSWSPGADPSLVTTVSGPPLLIRSASNVEIEGFDFRAPEATPDSRSSVAGTIDQSDRVLLRNVTLRAADGRSGETGAPPEAALSRAPAGNAAMQTSGGAAQNSCVCETSAEQSVGGAGGDTSGSGSKNGIRGEPDWGGGAGGTAGPPCQGGFDGKVGPLAEPGAGADNHGDTDGVTWIPADGKKGGSGAVGQGGGGGGSAPAGGGGSGGCGGCGGNGGEPGTGGGSSIALLVLSSTVTLEDVSVETGDAGSGGDGSPGQRGQQGGAGGDGLGCPGGAGAAGGDGALGGGGAGGISVGVVYRGTEAPIGLDGLRIIQLGDAGSGGGGGGIGLAGVREAFLAIE